MTRVPSLLRILSGALAAAALLGIPRARAQPPATGTPPMGAFADSIHLAKRHLEERRPARAESLGLRLLASVEAAGRGDSVEAAQALEVVVTARLRQGRYASGLVSLARRSADIYERVQGPAHPDLATALSRLSEACYYAEPDAGCEFPAAYRSLSIRERAWGPSQPEYAEALGWIGWLRLQNDSIPAARETYERALDIMERSLGPDHPRVVGLLNGLASTVGYLGQLDRARALHERAIGIISRDKGPDSPALLVPLCNLGTLLHFELNDFEAAGVVLERALRIAEANPGPLLGTCLLNLGELRMNLGDYARARALVERATGIVEGLAGREHETTAWCYTTLGIILGDTGDFTGARTHLENSIRIREKLLGPDDSIVAYSLLALAKLLMQTGETRDAVSLLKRALDLRTKAFGNQGFLVAESQYRLAEALVAAGDLDGARRYYEEALGIVDSTSGAHSTWGTNSLVGLAGLLRRMGRSAEAVPLLQRSLGILEQKLGRDHMDIGWVLTILGDLQWELGNRAEALSLLDRAVRNKERSAGPEHPDLAWALSTQAPMLLASGRIREAHDAALRAEEISREHLRLTVRNLSERQALLYGGKRTSGLDVLVAIAAMGDSAVPGAVEDCWDQVVRSRSLVLDEMAARRRGHGAGPAVDSLEAGYAAARQRLANLLVQGSGDQSPEKYRAVLDRAERESDAAERALAAASSAFRAEREQQRAGLAEVRAALPESGALVSYVMYRDPGAPGPSTGGETRPDRYAALVAARDGEPRAVALGSARAIDSLVAAWRREAARPASGGEDRRSVRAYERAGRALRGAIWDPVAALVQGTRHVLVVPAGDLTRVSFDALPLASGMYLAEEGPTIHYASAERDALPSHQDARAGGLLALGDPDYDSAIGSAGSPELLASADAATAGPGARVFRGEASGCPDFRRLHWNRIPETGRELEELVELWSGGDGAGRSAARAVRGAEASEFTLKRAGPGWRAIHLATHGFFLGAECGGAAPGSRGIGGIVRPGGPAPAARITENPLRLSGLVLAGANRRGRAGAGREDGILTAEEIGAMDLSGVEWVVLSACETGLGDVQAREGVFGLRRAFQTAGARTLIMSLWPVDDAATRAWMRYLYEARLLEGKTTAESVRAANLRSLQDRRARGASTHPFTWAGFVAAGDWR